MNKKILSQLNELSELLRRDEEFTREFINDRKRLSDLAKYIEVIKRKLLK